MSTNTGLSREEGVVTEKNLSRGRGKKIIQGGKERRGLLQGGDSCAKKNDHWNNRKPTQDNSKRTSHEENGEKIANGGLV